MMNRRAMIAAAAAATLGGGAWWLTRPAPGSEGLLPMAANAQEATGSAEPVEITDMVLGDPEAPIEVIEYASFTCPHCASFHANQFKALQENYINPGKVRFIYREVYFRGDLPALWASMIARCGGEVRFFGITGLIFDQQQDWARSQDPNEMVQKLMTIGKTAGMTDEEVGACMQNGALAEALASWDQSNREVHNISGTPSLVIDGEMHSNMSFDDLAAILDAKLDG